MTEIVGKIFFDDILFVAAADDEFIDTVVAVSFHDMPQDGLSSDFNHRLGIRLVASLRRVPKPPAIVPLSCLVYFEFYL